MTATSKHFRKIVLTLGRISFVVAVTLLAWFSLAASIIAICATLLIVLHGKASSIIEFSFGPLKAKIERELSDAEKLVEKLRKMAAIQARQAIAASARTGRFASDDDWIFVASKRTESSLRDLGIPEEDIREARTDLIDLTLFDFGHAATGGSFVPTKLGEQAHIEWKELRKAEKIRSPDAIESWLQKWSVLTPARKQIIEDMRWVVEHHDIRDSAQYMRAHQPIGWDEM